MSATSEDLGTLRDDLGAFGGVFSVGIAGLHACARFHDNFDPCLCEIGQRRGYQRDAPLPRETFSGNTNNHGESSDSF